MENKVKFGLKNVHIFPIKSESNTTTTYGEAISLAGAINLSLSVEGDESTFYADDIAYYQTFANNGYSGDLEIALLNDEFATEILGQTKDSNGAIIENVNDKVKSFAMAFEFQGDVNATRNILYKVTASRPNEEHQTIGETKEPQTDSLSIKAIGRMHDGRIKAKIREGQTGYDDFYEKPYEATVSIKPSSDSDE